MTHFLAKIYFSIIRVLKSKKGWLDGLKKLICLDQSRSCNSFYVEKIQKCLT